MVRISETSDPASGSLIAIAATSSPAHSPGSQRLRCSSVVRVARYVARTSLCATNPGAVARAHITSCANTAG